MAKLKEDLTFDRLPNATVECDFKKVADVMEEINRCRGAYESRQIAKKKKAFDIKPLYWNQMKKRELADRYPIYKFWCIHPKPKPYEPCQHIGQIILDRDILTKNEHISYLAQPKKKFQRLMRPPRCIHQRKFLPNCTSRINSLAHPKVTRVRHNFKDFHHVLSQRQTSNLRRTLQPALLEITTIQRALIFIKEEQRLQSAVKNKAAKKCARIKRKLLRKEKQHIRKIIFALYEVMKEYLTTDQFTLEPKELSCLCKVIESSIIQFCGLDNSTTSHVQHLLKTVSQNLAIWIEKFTANCGFRTPYTDRQPAPCKGTGKMDENELLLPVEDYIPYKSPTLSEAQEYYYPEEENLEEDYGEGQ